MEGPGPRSNVLEGDPDAGHVSGWQRVEMEKVAMRRLLGALAKVEGLERNGTAAVERLERGQDGFIRRKLSDCWDEGPRVLHAVAAGTELFGQRHIDLGCFCVEIGA